MFASKQGTVIAEGLKIVGTVTAEGVVEVNGQVDGEMHCTSLIVARSALITGTITADRVTIDGKVEGPIKCGDAVLKSQAHVLGDIQCQSLVVEKGAIMEGRLIRASNGVGLRSDTLLTRMPPPVDTGDDALTEVRHLSVDPDLTTEEAVPFLAKKGKAPTKALLAGDGSREVRSVKASKI